MFSVLLFWLSRLQLPGHAFGLALAWLCLLAAFWQLFARRWLFAFSNNSCLFFLTAYSRLLPCLFVVLGHKFVFVFGCFRPTEERFSLAKVLRVTPPDLHLPLATAATFLVISTKKRNPNVGNLKFSASRQSRDSQGILLCDFRMLHDLRAQLEALAMRTRKS